MAFDFDKAIQDDMLAKGFEQKHVRALVEAAIGTGQEAGADLSQWPRSAFESLEGFGPMAASLAYELVQRYAKEQIGLSGDEDFDFPKFPPYLDSMKDYDPHNPLQFWTDPNGRSWRWCAKAQPDEATAKAVRAAGNDPHCKTCGPEGAFAHPVTVVSHDRRGTELVPSALEASLAVNSHMQWYHRGYNCWISEDGKPLGEVPRERRVLARAAIEADQEIRRAQAYGAPLPV